MSDSIQRAHASGRESAGLQGILDSFRDDARGNRDLGDRFERLVLQYLQVDPLYVDRFSDVWMWSDWPDKGRIGDIGIDLVARERATGDYCAIQCKFYLPEHTLSKADLDSFFTALGKPAFKTGLIISTTDKWGKNAEDALEQTKNVTRIGLHNLADSPVDWSRFDPTKPDKLALVKKKKLRPHQAKALKDVAEGLETADRGKLIMACGTGKTFTALKIAETLAPKYASKGTAGHVLFLVPSLSLLAQTLREWTSESGQPIHSLAVCSDLNIGKRREKKGNDDAGEITVHDLAFPATTNAKQLVNQYDALKESAKKAKEPPRLTVVFSTYQSIDAVAKAQKAGLPDFDLIVCDEAHRTTGVTLANEDESAFVRVHDADFLKGTKRLYMTATPRLYGDAAKSRAEQESAELASMDDESLFGKELHRLGFGEAVEKDLLADYKVLVLAVDEKYVSKTFQSQAAGKTKEIPLADATKITGCWNGLAKQFDKAASVTDGEGGVADLKGDVQPMRRAVAFSRSIADSKKFVAQFGQIVAAYKDTHPDLAGLLNIEADHVDGTFDALRRGTLLEWLKADSPAGTCRILSNAKCLSEGVDVPALDAVLFLNPRNSVIDVVQSVGRVMRKAPGKTYGYIILPIGIPADVKPEDALKNNANYAVVWQVLQALRAHDDRFNATINQLDLNQQRPNNIQVIGVTGPATTPSNPASSTPGGAGDLVSSAAVSATGAAPVVTAVQGVFNFPQLEEWKDAIYAKIVLKCGQREYLEKWAAEVAVIAERHVTRIKALLDDPQSKQAKAFAKFLASLQQNLNPAVSEGDAIEMLAQHLITGPVFDALFGNSQFTKLNPVSKSMQKMLDLLQNQAIGTEAETLAKFYDAVRKKVEGVDNAEARQTIIKTLYDEFFNVAFPKMAARLGIVYTPVEVVDFIIRSVEDVLRDEFGSGLGEKDVHIIDPFTGTGTFLVRLLQSGLIPPNKLAHKYQHEIHANEIVLLAYYIAAINIEETFHGLMNSPAPQSYLPFDGICLTDTFQLYESGQQQIEGTFPENTARVARQRQSPIRVVIANPPYSVGQESQNDDNQNLRYTALDARINATYAARSSATLVRNLYDSYVRAIRWASDRIQGRGVVGFVTNGYFIDGNAMDGLRACLTEEFSSLYVFNLRGNQRTSGEVSRQEGGKIFGSGARTPVAITLLVRNPNKSGPCTIHYHDIGDYLTREEKLAIVKGFASITGIGRAGKWTTLRPNADHDWINHRDPAFERFLPIGDKDDATPSTIFGTYSMGVVTGRDDWVYNASFKALEKLVTTSIITYCSELQRYAQACMGIPKSDWPDVESVLEFDQTKISWTRALKNDLKKQKALSIEDGEFRIALYRPFVKRNMYFSRRLNEMVLRVPSFFPTVRHKNVCICITGPGNRDAFSVSLTDTIPDLHFADKSGGSQCFPLYLYEPADKKQADFTDQGEIIDGYRRREAITDGILKTFRTAYGPKVVKEDIFYYVYGILHSQEYRMRFAADLKKMLPRIPLTKEATDFQAFSDAGRKLAEWHLNYETVEPWPVEEHNARFAPTDAGAYDYYKVQKMTFARPTAEQKAAGAKWDKTRIIYNADITFQNIPLEAYDYVVNGKPAIEWILERYQVTRDKDSGISNDPNDWAREHEQPRYILDLLKRVIRVSIETMKIVSALPALNERIGQAVVPSPSATSVVVPIPAFEAIELLVAILDELKPARAQQVAAERMLILALNNQARDLFEKGSTKKSSIISQPGDHFRVLWQTISQFGYATINSNGMVTRSDVELTLTDPIRSTMAKESVALFKRCEEMEHEWPAEVNNLEYVLP
jgi:predicted helicase